MFMYKNGELVVVYTLNIRSTMVWKRKTQSMKQNGENINEKFSSWCYYTYIIAGLLVINIFNLISLYVFSVHFHSIYIV